MVLITGYFIGQYLHFATTMTNCTAEQACVYHLITTEFLEAGGISLPQHLVFPYTPVAQDMFII